MAPKVIQAKADSEMSSTGAREMFLCQQCPRTEGAECINWANAGILIEDRLEQVIGEMRVLTAPAQLAFYVQGFGGYQSEHHTHVMPGGGMDIPLVMPRLEGIRSLGGAPHVFASTYVSETRRSRLEDFASVDMMGIPADVFTWQSAARIFQAICDFESSQMALPQAELASVSPAVVAALRQGFSNLLPDDIFTRLTELAQESFRDIEKISFELIEDPEILGDKKVCMNINLRGDVEDVSTQYDRYIDLFIERIPPEISYWITTDINMV